MDTVKFGHFISERRKELKMTQKELAEKLQVTDKAVSKWERGLGFPDISTIENLANALDVSITELMKSEREIEKNTQDQVMIHDVIDVAKEEVKQSKELLLGILAATMFLCTILETIQSISWNAQQLTMNANIPYTALIPGFVLILYAMIGLIQGKKVTEYAQVGVILLLIPFVITMGAFLILGILAS